MHGGDPAGAGRQGLPPGEHLVDAGYVDAELLVSSREEPPSSWSARRGRTRAGRSETEGGYGIEHFAIDWERERVRCPQGKLSSTWSQYIDRAGAPYILGPVREGGLRRLPGAAPCAPAPRIRPGA